MRNLSFPTIRAFGSAAAECADATGESAKPLTLVLKWLTLLKLPLLAILTAVVAVAQTIPPDIAKKLDDLEKAAKSAQMAGDNAWMLTSSALVLMMTGPGLALFYGGLVRRKISHARFRKVGYPEAVFVSDVPAMGAKYLERTVTVFTAVAVGDFVFLADKEESITMYASKKSSDYTFPIGTP